MTCEMACDHLIYNCEKKPIEKDIGIALVDYLGDDLIKELRWSEDRWFVALKSERSHPLRHLVDPAILFLDQKPDDGRWFEVWVKDKTVGVITRRQDELTNNIALGFAKLVARFWGGRLEDK